jgi:hypothetical protein
MHKRKAFEHEREVRALKIQPNIIDIESVERDFDENKYRELNPEGIKVPIDIASTFDAVYVDPYAPKWYFEVVKEVLNKFSITIPLEWSQIADKPNY